MVIKQSNYTNRPTINILNDEDEFEVADVLLDLPYLITHSLSTYRFPYDWASKKLRSAAVLPPLSPPCRRNLTPSPLTVEASSPNTPLSFSPSESDSKPPPPPLPLPSKKRKPAPGLHSRKKEIEEDIRERLQTQQQLKESIEKVKEYYKLRLAENSELKAIKQKFLQLQTTAIILQQQTTNDRVHAVPSTSAEYHSQAPLILDPHQLQAGPTQFLTDHHSQPQLESVNGLMRAGPLQQEASLINRHNHGQHQPEVVNNLVRASPLSTPQFQLHNHSQPTPGVVNNQVFAGSLSKMQFRYPQPLIPNQQYKYVCNLAAQYNQGCQLDLNLKPQDDANYRASTAEARKRRLQVHKEKKTRVPMKSPYGK